MRQNSTLQAIRTKWLSLRGGHLVAGWKQATSTLSVAFVLSICSPFSVAGPVKLYWSAWGDTIIRRSNLDGTQSEQLIRTSGGVVPNIAFDPVEQKMYWPSPVAGGIQRGHYDGSDADTIIAGIAEPTIVAIDSLNRKAYWVDYGTPSTIWRGNLDGTGREQIVDNLIAPRDVQVDSLHGYYYWADFFGDIHRKSFDGTQTDASFFARSPRQIAIDSINGYIYATDSSFQAIIRMRLDFSEPTLWVTQGISNPEGIVVDIANARVIWSNQEKSAAFPDDTNISSVNFAGGDQRIDFYPQWNDYISALVRHLAIVEIPTPEPSSLLLASVGGMAISCFLMRRGSG
jgi:DNA-binding beta-propeller fold protein YncE